ncbi:MAG: hypothetical protein HXS50_00075, partial [Theionarchaea archaeon]|nr:hypothetical protein [Theionarchaea archaeon]
MGDDSETGVEGEGPSKDPYLEWLNREKARKIFNLGDYSMEVSEDRVVVRGKVGREWGKERVFDRESVDTSIEPRSRKSQYILYVGFGFYILGFMTLFVADGMMVPDQLNLFAFSLFVLLLPILLYAALPMKPFLIGSALFYLVLFSLPAGGQLGTMFQIVEEMLGEGYVEAFFVGASFLPIIMHIIVRQTLVRYDFWLKEGDRTFHSLVSGRVAPIAMNYIRNWTPPRGRFSVGKFMWSDFQLFFLRLGKARMKSCF